MGLGLAFHRQGLKVLHWGLHVQGLVGPDVVVEVLVLGELRAHFVKGQPAGVESPELRSRRVVGLFDAPVALGAFGGRTNRGTPASRQAASKSLLNSAPPSTWTDWTGNGRSASIILARLRGSQRINRSLNIGIGNKPSPANHAGRLALGRPALFHAQHPAASAEAIPYPAAGAGLPAALGMPIIQGHVAAHDCGPSLNRGPK